MNQPFHPGNYCYAAPLRISFMSPRTQANGTISPWGSSDPMNDNRRSPAPVRRDELVPVAMTGVSRPNEKIGQTAHKSCNASSSRHGHAQPLKGDVLDGRPRGRLFYKVSSRATLTAWGDMFFRSQFTAHSRTSVSFSASPSPSFGPSSRYRKRTSHPDRSPRKRFFPALARKSAPRGFCPFSDQDATVSETASLPGKCPTPGTKIARRVNPPVKLRLRHVLIFASFPDHIAPNSRGRPPAVVS